MGSDVHLRGVRGLYYAIFAAVDTSGWHVGALFGLLAGVVAYGAIVGGLVSIAA